MITDDLEALKQIALDTLAASFPTLTVFLDNEPNDTAPVNDPWCRFVIRPGAKVMTQAGQTKKYQQLGTAILQVIVPPQNHEARGYEIAEALDVVLRDWRSPDGRITVYETEYRTFPSSDKEPNFIINYNAYWRSLRT